MNRSARETFACFSLRNRCGHVAKHVWAISKNALVLRAEDYALTDMFRNLLYFLLCQHPALATRYSILPTLSSGQCRDVLREVHSRGVHGSMEESPHVDPIATLVCREFRSAPVVRLQLIIYHMVWPSIQCVFVTH